MRLHQPTGIYLLLWPCFWGLSLAGASDIWLFLLFAAGAIIMRGAGCVINDICDRNFDRLVERTKSRPIAAGEISVQQAIIFLALLLLVGLGILLQLPPHTITLGIGSMAFVVIYPLMKRITFWPQLFLGFTFNFGALMGYSAAAGKIDYAAIMLYSGAIFWTLGYDTIYAFQDIKYDRQAGVKSSAIRLEKHIKPALSVIYGIAILLMLLSLVAAGTNIPTYAGLAAFSAHLGWQIYKFQPDDPASAMAIFKSNRIAGAILWLGIVSNLLMA